MKLSSRRCQIYRSPNENVNENVQYLILGETNLLIGYKYPVL